MRAIVAAFRLDERTLARWQKESGLQSRRVLEHLIEAGKVAFLEVQADEIRVKAVGGIYCLASAMEVRSRLWLGGVLSRHHTTPNWSVLYYRECAPVARWRESCW